MKQVIFNFLTAVFLSSTLFNCSIAAKPGDENFFSPSNKNIQYTGRIDFTNLEKPKFWQPGVYIKAKFEGTFCKFILNDEVLWGKSHNYIEVVVDDTLLYRIQTKSKTDTIDIAKDLTNDKHTILICKNTEANIGYLEFAGFICKNLLPLPAKPKRKIEFIGNSITCGTGSDQSVIPCGKGKWEDQHNAYMSYGPQTARNLNAQWQISAVSGIGLIHSCCDLTITMPQVFDKVSMRNDTISWDFSEYKADVVTICLGQNDGVQDSTTFCTAYLDFIKTIRSHYPEAIIVCLTSPMGDERLTLALKNYLGSIVTYLNKQGDKKVDKYFFSKQYHNGCDNHPDLEEHKLIADELTNYLSKKLHW